MKNKKIFTLGALVLTSSLFACGGGENPSSNPVSEEPSVSESLSETPNSEEVVSSEDINSSENEPAIESSEEEKKPLAASKLYVVGDSTACSFNDATYYYPRYGFGTQLSNYFHSELEVVNLALSGRSSKSFLSESNYNTLKTSIKEGDYLLVAFGHNDEKGDDATRFTDARLDTNDPASFKYSLYENYIKLAEEKGATPILATPIVRLHPSSDYDGSSGHVTEYGNYSQAIRDLGVEKEVPVIDLTSYTKALYTDEGYEVAQYYHAMTTGKKDASGEVVADTASVDKTHLNVYGAKKVAYLFANGLKDSTSPLKDYVDETKLVSPTKENDLVVNPSYVYSDYAPFDGTSYSPVEQFQTISEGWYGTAFGDLGGDPLSTNNGYFAKEEIEGVFTVGQNSTGTTSSSNYKGKIASNNEGFAYLFRQVDASKNFTLTVEAKVLMQENQNQAGFGLMLRDDCYVPTRNASILGNYVTAGFLTNSDETINANFYRQSSVLNKGSTKVSGLYQIDDTATLSIVRLGQKVTVSTTYKGQTYTNEYLDFPLQEKDQGNMYIGMFGARGTLVEYTNVNFEITGDAIEA